jgi:hypothetical protein
MKYLLIINLLLLGNVISVSHAEGQDMGKGLRSPIGRHQLESYFHYFMFVIHDISSVLACILIVFQFLRNKDRLHHIYGYTFLVNFFIALITGFWLIYIRSNDDKLHINSKEINLYTITTQGYCLIALFLHTFILGKRTLNKNFILFVKILHYFNILTGIRSLIFLGGNILRECNHKKEILNRENSIEMFLTVTLPQLIVEVLYLYIIRQLEKQDFKNFDWYKHHKMGIVFIVLISVPGIIFNVVHDSYWLFAPPGIHSVNVRVFFLVAPLWAFVWFQRDKLEYIVELKNVIKKK